MILNDVPEYPDNMDPLARDLIDKLLKPQMKRLGCGRDGVLAIKQHPFFAEIDWTSLTECHLTGPLNPNIQRDGDTQWFTGFQTFDQSFDNDLPSNFEFDCEGYFREVPYSSSM